MMGARVPNPKEAKPNQRVTAIGYTGDAYRVTLGTGKTDTFREFNLRFRSDSNADAPHPRVPIIVGKEFEVIERRSCSPIRRRLAPSARRSTREDDVLSGTS
jgi:hypothetical protein